MYICTFVLCIHNCADHNDRSLIHSLVPMCSAIIIQIMTIYNGQECMMISSFIVEGGRLGCHHRALFLITLACIYTTCCSSKTRKEEMSLGIRLYCMDKLSL